MLISDCAHAIINGFHAVFPDGENTVCWAHVKMNVQKQSFRCEQNKELVLNDIDLLQLSPNKEAFEKASDLLCKKWSKKEKTFVDYFKKNWLDKNNSWF